MTFALVADRDAFDERISDPCQIAAPDDATARAPRERGAVPSIDRMRLLDRGLIDTKARRYVRGERTNQS